MTRASRLTRLGALQFCRRRAGGTCPAASLSPSRAITVMTAKRRTAFALLIVLAATAAEIAHGQQFTASTSIEYCPALRGVVALAQSKGRFAAISGNARDGDFLD